MVATSGIITYNRPQNSATTPTELETEYRISSPSGNAILTEVFMTLDPDNVAQVSTVTLSLGSAGDEYAIAIAVGADSWVYRHKQTASDTTVSMAAFLAAIINTNTNVKASASSGVITITSLIPGQAFTPTVTESTTAGNLVVATPTANAGTALHRKIGQMIATFSVNNLGFPQISTSGSWYNGASVPVLQQNFGPLLGVGNATLDSIQTAQGVARA